MCELIITIDGPAGTGKSTVAHRLAKRLGLEFLDTGAMYRAATLLSIDRGIAPHEGRALAEALREADLHFDFSVDPPRLMLAGRDVAGRVRDRDISERVSTVAGQPDVRAVLVAQQRHIARLHPRLVTEGRDQGSVVFPGAPVRFYLDARPEIRAARRTDQLAAIGKQVERALVLDEILSRDRLDSSRSDAPLIRPQGAIVIDTSDLSLDAVVDRLEQESRAALARAGRADLLDSLEQEGTA
jgi:cytidylate kinase